MLLRHLHNQDLPFLGGQAIKVNQANLA